MGWILLFQIHSCQSVSSLTPNYLTNISFLKTHLSSCVCILLCLPGSSWDAVKEDGPGRLLFTQILYYQAHLNIARYQKYASLGLASPPVLYNTCCSSDSNIQSKPCLLQLLSKRLVLPLIIEKYKCHQTTYWWQSYSYAHLCPLMANLHLVPDPLPWGIGLCCIDYTINLTSLPRY